MLLRLYERLLDFFGPQNWWPVNHDLEPPEWEIMVGAVLTQNTSWTNVEKVLDNLSRAGIKNRKALLSIKEKELAELIRPSGYYNQKAKKLRILADFKGEISRENLLSLWGIGPETADSILLYSQGKAYFVVDMYTRRMFSRLELVNMDAGYEEIRHYFENRLPRDPRVYREFHALIVRMAKDFCKAKPSCEGCPMEKFCGFEPKGKAYKEKGKLNSK